MNDLVKSAYCVVPAVVLKALFFAGINGIIVISILRLLDIVIPAEFIISLVAFFFVGAVLVSHGMSILRCPSLILLVCTVLIISLLQLQTFILN